MGNSLVEPIIEHSAPWVMVTYNPRPHYKNFVYNEKFDVFCNRMDLLGSLKVEPSPPTSSIQLNLDQTDVIQAVQDLNFEDDMKVEELVNKLLERCCCGNRGLTEADKVRLLFYWITAQNVKYSEYSPTVDFETVNYQLQRLQDGKNSYAAFFSLLCHYARVPCVIIRGHVKGGRYEADKPLTDDLIREWNAVLVDSQWRFVDTFWGRIYHDQTITRDEWYLFPKPSHLIYTHFPENKKWQLVKTRITKDMFLRQPVLRRRFFQMNMQTLSHTAGEVSCSDGQLEVSFLLKARNADSQEFCCVVSRRNDGKLWEEERLPKNICELHQIDYIKKMNSLEEDGTFQRADDCSSVLSDQVIPLNRDPLFEGNRVLTMKISFLQTGYHKIEIVGRQSELEDFDWVAIYHVNVLSIPDLPNIGWGPNPYLEKCGLKAISHLDGKIKCFVPNQMEIKFKILPDAETNNVKLRYRVRDIKEKDLNDFPEKEVDIFTPDNRVICIPVYVAHTGEYKLSVAAILNETDKGDVIHYKIVGIQDVSDTFLEAQVEEVLKELDEAVSSKNLHDLRKAIESATSKKVQKHPKVRDKYREADRLYNSVLNYENALKRIGQIDNNHITIVKSYTNPDDVVVKVMTAVFILLGEPKSRLRNWDDIKLLLKSSSLDGFHRRINKVNSDIKALPAKYVRKAETILKDLNTLDALKVTEDVVPFRKWVDSIIKAYYKS